MTKDQQEFIALHGVTKCPPSPVYRMPWGATGKPGRFTEQSEPDQIAMLHGGGCFYDAGFVPHKLTKRSQSIASQGNGVSKYFDKFHG